MSSNAERRRGRRMVRWAGAAVVVAMLVVAVVGVWQAVLNRPRAASSSGQVATATAAVSRGTVTERVQIAGTLGFAGSYSVAHQGMPGITTWVAEAGSTVDRGDSLYAVANEPVRLLIGTLPAYRDFAAGMPDGPDVQQLEENLSTLGMRPGKVDTKFTADTATAIERWQPTVVLLDLFMPGPNGISVLAQIKQDHPATEVLMLTSSTDDEHLLAAVRAGALAYLPKTAGVDQLVASVRAAARGESLLEPRIAARLVREVREIATRRKPLDQLSPREVEVLTVLARGRTNREIARLLSISEETVKAHMSSILTKLGLTDRTQAAIFGLQQRLVPLDQALLDEF